MGNSSAEAEDCVLDVSETDFEQLARSKSPMLARAARRILDDANDPNDVSTGFQSSL